MKKLTMLVAALLVTASANAASMVVDGVTWYYETFSCGGKTCARIISGSVKYAGDLKIPSSLSGYPVTEINSSAFYGCTGLTSVTIPTSVTSIGGGAFSGCSGLTHMTLPFIGLSRGGSGYNSSFGYVFGETRLFGYVFGATWYDGSIAIEQCSDDSYYGRTYYIPSSLVSVEITDATVIGCGAFSNCSGLTSVTIPTSVTSIGDCAFYNCSGLTSVTIPEGVTSIGSSAFYNCSGLTRVNITNLEKWCGISFDGYAANPLAYAHCLYLNDEEVKDLTIPEGVTSIGDYMFYNCSGLTSVTIPEGVTSIGRYTFSDCSGLTSVTIPSSVTSIGDRAFYNCSGLTSVTIPSSVTSIGDSAFRYCSGLTSVTIPSSVTSIGIYAFENCSGLRSVEFLGPPPSGLGNSRLLSYGGAVFPREYGKDWLKIRGINSFFGYGQGEKLEVEILSAAIRENDPTVMDVVYKVKSAKPTVKVRALAFQDGERSFAKVVRPTEFIEDTAKNIGDEIAANEEHKLSWRVSTDWKVDLAKVKFEVLALDGDLLPLEMTTLPKIGDHAAMETSWNAMTEQQVLDALLWLFADGDAGLTLSNGVLKNGTVQLVNKTSLSAANAIGYVYGKMGFSVLSGNELKYANEMTRLGLSQSGVRQYAWRTVEE